MRKFLLLLGTLFFLLPQLYATHNRAGEIIYRKLPGNTLKYEITIITYTKISAPTDRDSLQLEIYYCPEGSEPLDAVWVTRDAKVEIIDDVARNVYTLDAYTLPGPGCYRFSMYDPNRTPDIINMSNPVQEQFYLEDTLKVIDPQFFGYNSSPVLTKHPIVFAGQYFPFRHNPGAYDPDGDSLSYSLIPPMQDQGQDVGGYLFPDNPQFTNNPSLPNDFDINNETGEITWDVPQKRGIYNVAILIREFREGKHIGSIIRDMQIWVNDSSNSPPQVTNLQDTCVIAGDELQAFLDATDPDNDVITTFSAVGGPFEVNSSPANWITNAPRTAPATGQFTWQTNCSHVRRGDYVVVFTAEDDYRVRGDLQPYSDAETWLIQVVGPPPQNLTTEIDQPNTRVKVSWDSLYACEAAGFDNFVGFSVWRKRGCDSTVIDKCSPDQLKQYGYQRISGAKPINGYTYYDNTAKVGVVYSYRVQAEFGEIVPGPKDTFFYNQVGSVPSNASCAQLKSDIPVITHADVRTTDAANGAVMVKWYPPDQEALDTVKNPGPYKYELFSNTGLNKGNNPTLLTTITAQQFYELKPDSFLHAGINTREVTHTYSIKFYAKATEPDEYKVGETEGASTVFLQTTASNKQINLTWNESVPWANYKYEVFRKHPDSTSYSFLATTTNQQYLDDGLDNQLEYCYFVRAFGSYSNARLPDPLINNSQRLCDVPRDTVPPCTPALTVSNNCDNVDVIDPGNFRNQLSWSDPRTECDDLDLAGYNIYYAPTSNDSLQLLEHYDDPDKRSYTHSDLSSLAGCYAVTALDTFGNESQKSNKTCLDNCPLYKLPNAFTPNGDGSNDLFTPIKPYYFIDHVEMKIFNRWGNLVYQTNDPDINWDGTNFRTGEPVPEGAYHYVCEVYEVRVSGVERKLEPLSGYIQLVR